MTPRVHIYPLSRIVHAWPGGWETLLRSIEAGKEFAFGYYLPVREAVVSYCRGRGAGRSGIVRDMVSRAVSMGGVRGPRIAKDNEAAFQTFEAFFYPRIKRFRRDLLRESQHGCEFGGLELLGSPHLLVVDEGDRERFVHLHPSAWRDEDLKAYLELLCVIVEQRFDSAPASIWCMNLRTGMDVPWRPSKRLRVRCEKAARLLARFLGAMASE
jgi:hypothetical protein